MPRRKTAVKFLSALAATLALSLYASVAAPAPFLGSAYGALSRFRPPMPESPSILLLEVAPGMDTRLYGSAAWADCLLSLEEAGVDKVLSSLPLDAPRPDGAWSAERKERLEESFAEEFSGIRKNVSTLFDAIRQGSVRAKDAPRFVDELLGLVDRSGERLLASVIEGGETGDLSRARGVFGPARLAENVESLGFTPPKHAGALAIAELPEPVGGVLPFRRLDIALVFRYIALDSSLYALVEGMESDGYLALLEPESHPRPLYEEALSLREDLLERPGDSAAGAWRASRRRYVEKVGALLSGGIEAELLAGFDELLKSEDLDEDGAKRTDELRRAVARSFAQARATLAEFLSVRSRLEEAARGSLCVIGSGPEPSRAAEDVWLYPTAAESAAASINDALLGRGARAPSGWKRAAAIALPGALAAALLAPLGSMASVAVGLGALAATLGIFIAAFLSGGIWIHPALPGAAVALGAAASILAGAMLRRSPAAPAPRAALPSDEGGTARAVILAVRHVGETANPEFRDNEARAAALRAFHEAVEPEIAERGGIILGAEEFVVLAGFVARLDSSARGEPRDAGALVREAVAAARGIAASKPEASLDWRFGLDYGECAFFRSRLTGHGATGRPLVYARILSSLARKYGATILATGGIVREAGDSCEARRLDSLVEKSSGLDEAFYELIFPRAR